MLRICREAYLKPVRKPLLYDRDGPTAKAAQDRLIGQICSDPREQRPTTCRSCSAIVCTFPTRFTIGFGHTGWSCTGRSLNAGKTATTFCHRSASWAHVRCNLSRSPQPRLSNRSPLTGRCCFCQSIFPPSRLPVLCQPLLRPHGHTGSRMPDNTLTFRT